MLNTNFLDNLLDKSNLKYINKNIDSYNYILTYNINLKNLDLFFSDNNVNVNFKNYVFLELIVEKNLKEHYFRIKKNLNIKNTFFDSNYLTNSLKNLLDFWLIGSYPIFSLSNSYLNPRIYNFLDSINDFEVFLTKNHLYINKIFSYISYEKILYFEFVLSPIWIIANEFFFPSLIENNFFYDYQKANDLGLSSQSKRILIILSRFYKKIEKLKKKK